MPRPSAALTRWGVLKANTTTWEGLAGCGKARSKVSSVAIGSPVPKGTFTVLLSVFYSQEVRVACSTALFGVLELWGICSLERRLKTRFPYPLTIDVAAKGQRAERRVPPRNGPFFGARTRLNARLLRPAAIRQLPWAQSLDSSRAAARQQPELGAQQTPSAA
jgi:hypothetical protein